MTTFVDEKQVRDAVSHWDGKTPMMCMEEFAELIQAISKMERKGDVDHLKEEMRDAYISLKMLEVYYNLSEEEIEKMIYKKLNTKKDK